MGDETIVLKSDGVFKWDGPKRKQTVIKAKLGRLVLTDRRLVFLSTGHNDLSLGKLLGGANSPEAVLDVASTGSLGITALTNEGAIDVPVARLRGAELHGMFKVMTVRWMDGGGGEHTATFAEKNAGMPNGPIWVAQIQRVSAPAAAVTQPQAAPTSGMPASSPNLSAAAPAAWLADPLGRHQLRYWDGSRWTQHVSDGGQPGTDPIS